MCFSNAINIASHSVCSGCHEIFARVVVACMWHWCNDWTNHIHVPSSNFGCDSADGMSGCSVADGIVGSMAAGTVDVVETRAMLMGGWA